MELHELAAADRHHVASRAQALKASRVRKISQETAPRQTPPSWRTKPLARSATHRSTGAKPTGTLLKVRTSRQKQLRGLSVKYERLQLITYVVPVARASSNVCCLTRCRRNCMLAVGIFTPATSCSAGLVTFENQLATWRISTNK